MKRDGSLPQWPLYLIAAGATVTVWSGWVGLGEMTGFGRIHPLPGIWDGLTINTAITLPIGVEAYAAYALGAWLTRRTLSTATRKFASVSSVGALILGACGQVAYHLLAVGGHAEAPAWITTIVSCLPVLVLGMAATLTHLIRRDESSETEVVAGKPVELAAELSTFVATEDAPVGDTSSSPTGDSERQDAANEMPPTSDSDSDSSAASTPPTSRQQRPRATAKKTGRRSMTDWVETAGPIFHAEFERLQRQPTGDEFAEAIKKAGLGKISPSTAKNIRTEILDRAPLPSLESEGN